MAHEVVYGLCESKCLVEVAPKSKTDQLSNPNLLINGDFQVNQRGNSSYRSTGWSNRVYSVDRWNIHGDGRSEHLTIITVNDSGSIMLSSLGTAGAVYQNFEKKLKENTYTATVKVLSLTGSAIFYFDRNSKPLSVGINTLTYDGELSYIGIETSENSSVEIEYIKLEQGSIATPFVPRSYAEELALCERYYQIIGKINTVRYYYDGSLSFYCGFSFKTKMRATPTYNISTKHNLSVSCDTNDNGIKAFIYNGDNSSLEDIFISLDAELY